MKLPTKLIIIGNPMVKKNSRDIVRNKKTGRMYPIKSHALSEFEFDAAEQLKEQLPRSSVTGSLFPPFPLDEPLHIKFLFYRKNNIRVDLSNLYEFPQDVLQRAGIIENDCIIESHDGSRKFVDAENPRTEIYIYPMEKGK